MIECIFTIDYEIYGNGTGRLGELVHEPAQRLMELFLARDVRFVCFVEVAELQMIEEGRTDPAMTAIRRQLREMHARGFELGLHLHPQWYNGRYDNGTWSLDYDEYSLCTLPRERIVQVVDRALAYFRELLAVPSFTPLAFRAGNWLFQPAGAAARVLFERGIRIDSSVFKGGAQRRHRLDYRRALKNGHFWHFGDDVNVPDPRGDLLEVPIHTQMVPFWKMLTRRRAALAGKGISPGSPGQGGFGRLPDFLRLRYPQKFDFCRMSPQELGKMVDDVVAEDRHDPSVYRPIVAIGHTKDLTDLGTVRGLLSHLERHRVPVSGFREVYGRCTSRGADMLLCGGIQEAAEGGGGV